MRLRRTVAALVLAVLAAGGASAGGVGERDYVSIDEAVPGNNVEVRGEVVLLGSEPHTYFAVVISEGSAIAGENGGQAGTVVRLVGADERLRELQGRGVTVRGRLREVARGPGFPAEVLVDEIVPLAGQ